MHREKKKAYANLMTFSQMGWQSNAECPIQNAEFNLQ